MYRLRNSGTKKKLFVSERKICDSDCICSPETKYDTGFSPSRKKRIYHFKNGKIFYILKSTIFKILNHVESKK